MHRQYFFFVQRLFTPTENNNQIPKACSGVMCLNQIIKIMGQGELKCLKLKS